MSQQPQSSSNETNFSFAPAVPAQAISDTPGSARRAGAAVRSRTERLEVEHLQIASRCSVLLVPIEEVPKDRRQQGASHWKIPYCCYQRRKWPWSVGRGHA